MGKLTPAAMAKNMVKVFPSGGAAVYAARVKRALAAEDRAFWDAVCAALEANVGLEGAITYIASISGMDASALFDEHERLVEQALGLVELADVIPIKSSNEPK